MNLYNVVSVSHHRLSTFGHQAFSVADPDSLELCRTVSETQLSAAAVPDNCVRRTCSPITQCSRDAVWLLSTGTETAKTGDDGTCPQIIWLWTTQQLSPNILLDFVAFLCIKMTITTNVMQTNTKMRDFLCEISIFSRRYCRPSLEGAAPSPAPTLSTGASTSGQDTDLLLVPRQCGTEIIFRNY